MSIPMLGFKDIVGKTFESVELFVIEVLKVEKKNLFAVFPIGTTMQDGGKRKRSGSLLALSIAHIFYIFKKRTKNLLTPILVLCCGNH